MKSLTRIVAASAAAIALLIAASAPAQGGPGDGIVSIELEECTIVVTFGSSDGGQFTLQVWDDGELLGEDDFSVPRGGVGQGFYTITADVNQENPGLGIEVLDSDGEYVDGEDPYHGADEAIEDCAEEPTPRPTITRPRGTSTTAPTTTAPDTTTSTVPDTTSTSTVQTSTTAQPTTSTTVRPTTTVRVGGTGGSNARPPAAPAARPLSGAASYTG